LRTHNAGLEVVLVDLPVRDRLAAVRRGELDLALVRGEVTARGLRALPAWSEPLHAVVSTGHPAGRRDTVTLDELADTALRLPPRHWDRPLHDAVLRAVGTRPRLGRPAGTVQDTLVEVGADRDSWALLPADLVAGRETTRVRAIPVDPPVSVVGNVVLPDDGAPNRYVEHTVAAFRDPVPS
jgi:DNA-binding transcriptional LysR family regulator